MRWSVLAAGALLAVAALVAACGGGESQPAEEFFSLSDDSIRQLIPEARAFNLRVLSADEESGTEIDLTISTLLEGEPRMHVVSDVDAVAGADLVDEYEGVSIYKQKDTFWAELAADPPLYAGTPDEEGLRTYIDFYRSGGQELTDDRFWNGFAYAQERIGEAQADAPTPLVVAFNGELAAEAGGLRVEAFHGDRRVYVGILYSREDGADSGGFGEELVKQFREKFAVPDGAEEQPDNPEWGYEHRIWYSDSSSAGASE